MKPKLGGRVFAMVLVLAVPPYQRAVPANQPRHPRKHAIQDNEDGMTFTLHLPTTQPSYSRCGHIDS